MTECLFIFSSLYAAMFFQLRLTGVLNCKVWRVGGTWYFEMKLKISSCFMISYNTDPVPKDMDIVAAIMEFMVVRCGCDFTADTLTDRVFLVLHLPLSQ